MDEVWYRALTTVEHEGARFDAGALVGWQNPAVAANPDSFERVRVASDGQITPVPGGPVYLSPPRPAVLMSDGSIQAIARTTGAPTGVEREAGRHGRPGRPPWDDALFRGHYAAAVAATTPPLTPGRIAANFVALDGTTGVNPDHLARLRRKHGQ